MIFERNNHMEYDQRLEQAISAVYSEGFTPRYAADVCDVDLGDLEDAIAECDMIAERAKEYE
jgi:hypothetical protein